MKRIVSIGLLLLLSLAASAGVPFEPAKCPAGSADSAKCQAPSSAKKVRVSPEAGKKVSATEAPSTPAPVQGEPEHPSSKPRKIFSLLQLAMWEEVEFLQENQSIHPDQICDLKPHLCDDYKLCLKNAEIALANSRRSCPLPSQSSKLRFYTPVPQMRANKCAAIVLAGEQLIPTYDADGTPKAAAKGESDEPVTSTIVAEEGSDTGSSSNIDTESTPGKHDEGTPSPAAPARTRTIASSTSPVYEACGQEKSPLTSRMDNGALLPHSVYQITVRAQGDKWIPSASGENTECLRVLTDQHGEIRGKMMLSGLSGEGEERILIRSRFLGRQLPNPDGKLLPNRVYDAFALPGGKQKFVFAACDNQKDFRLPLVSLLQASPSTPNEVNLVGLKFVGEKTDGPKILAFTDAKPKDIKDTVPELFESKQITKQNKVKETSETISMAAFVEDK